MVADAYFTAAMPGAAHQIILEPSDSLSFALVAGSSPQAALTISNPSSVENVSFKVKTTRPMRYLVRPNQGVIAPNHTATVVVILQHRDCDELLRLDPSERQLSNDKFLVQSVAVNAEFCDLLTTKSAKEVMDDLTTLWSQVDKKLICNKKLRCAFVEGAATDSVVATPVQLTSALLEQGSQERDSLRHPSTAPTTAATIIPPSMRASMSHHHHQRLSSSSLNAASLVKDELFIDEPISNPNHHSPRHQNHVMSSAGLDERVRQEMMAEMALLRKKYDEVRRGIHVPGCIYIYIYRQLERSALLCVFDRSIRSCNSQHVCNLRDLRNTHHA